MYPYRIAPTITIFAPFIHTITQYNIEWVIIPGAISNHSDDIKRAIYLCIF